MMNAILSLVLLLGFLGTATALGPNELISLENIYNACGGMNWLRKTGWLMNSDPCGSGNNSWAGIVCAEPAGTIGLEVVGIDISSNHVVGVLPAGVFDAFLYLQNLNLGQNPQLSGPLPKPPYTLGLLQLGGTALRGPIPNLFTMYPSLTNLDVAGVNVGGTLDAAMQHYSQLNVFGVTGCQISGTIPDVFQNVPLGYIYLSHNSFSGTIPPSFFKGSLLQMQATNNMFDGTIPHSINMANSMTSLFLASNSLTGEVPVNVCIFTQLVELDLHDNGLDTLPDCLGGAPSLQLLDVSYNSITGTIPSGVCSSSSLQTLQFQENPNLGGVILPCLGSMPSLQTLTIENTLVSGTVPAGLLSASSMLRFLTLGASGFFGTIPDTLDQPPYLHTLVLNGNPLDTTQQFNGTIPQSLFRSQTIAVISLQNNQLTGTLGDLSKMPELTMVLLNSNKLLQGTFPKALFTDLWSIPGTNCSGPNPGNDCNRTLDLADCGLTGSLPDEIADGKDVSTLTLYGNKWMGYIPLLFNQSWIWLDAFRDNYFAKAKFLLAPIAPWAQDLLGEDYTGVLFDLYSITPLTMAKDVPTTITISGSGFYTFNELFCGVCAATVQNCANLTSYRLYPINVTDPDDDPNLRTLTCLIPGLDVADDMRVNILFMGRAYGVPNARYIVTDSSDLHIQSYDPHPVAAVVSPAIVRDVGCVRLRVTGGPFSSVPGLVCAVGTRVGAASWVNRNTVICELPLSNYSQQRVPAIITISHDLWAHNSTGAAAVTFIPLTCGGLSHCLDFHADPYGGCASGQYCECTSHGLCGNMSGGNCTCDFGFVHSLCDECLPERFGLECHSCPTCDHGTCDESRAGSGLCVCENIDLWIWFPARWVGATCQIDGLYIAGGIALVSIVLLVFIYTRVRNCRQEGYCGETESDNIQGE